jgi:intraflagellar transport protein 74
MTTAMRMGTAA